MNNYLKILINNGHHSIAEYNHLKTVCKNIGVTLIPCALNGDEVLNHIYKDTPDAVIMDMFLSGLDSIGVLHKINKNPPTKKPIVIVLSSFDSPKLNQTLYDNGVDKIVIKPYDVYAIISDVATQLISKNNR